MKSLTEQSPWQTPEMVARLSATPPNAELMQWAEQELEAHPSGQLLDIGCGAGCNALPLAAMGWHVLGLDYSAPMLEAAGHRADEGALNPKLTLRHALMDALPVEDAQFNFIVAHGIWNLAKSSLQFRKAVQEAARAARPGAALFVFTFSRTTLPPETRPVQGESFVYNDFMNTPQCFLTEKQLTEELKVAGFEQERGIPIRHYERPKESNRPSILEGMFRKLENRESR